MSENKIEDNLQPETIILLLVLKSQIIQKIIFWLKESNQNV